LNLFFELIQPRLDGNFKVLPHRIPSSPNEAKYNIFSFRFPITGNITPLGSPSYFKRGKEESLIIFMDLLDFIFPKKCVNCGAWGKYVCEKCEVGLWEEEQICPTCRQASRYGLRHSYCRQPWGMEGLTCLWAYEGIARKLIKQAKYKLYYDYLSELLSSLSLSLRAEYSFFRRFLEEKPVVVPVPLWPKREKERGFNQAEVIARLFASRNSLLLNRNLLLRVKDTGRQVGRTREERLKAMEGAFQFKIFNLKFKIPEAVLLVDDVWTTGATMNECAKVLRQAGVRKVWGLVLAR